MARTADGARSPKVSNPLAAALASVAAKLLGKFAASVDCQYRVSAGCGQFILKSLGLTLFLMGHRLPAL